MYCTVDSQLQILLLVLPFQPLLLFFYIELMQIVEKPAQYLGTLGHGFIHYCVLFGMWYVLVDYDSH